MAEAAATGQTWKESQAVKSGRKKPTTSTPAKKASVLKNSPKAGLANKSKPTKPTPKHGENSTAKETKSTKSKPDVSTLKNPSIPRPPVNSSPATSRKPGNPSVTKPAAAKPSSSKQLATSKETSAQAAAPKTHKPQPKLQKPKESTQTPTDTRPTFSDGKVAREIWQPADGNGDSAPGLIKKYRNKKSGHPTWKIYTGRNVPKQPTRTNPPHFVVLDDNSAWAILNSDYWTTFEKHRYWPFDFTPQGRISFMRPNRGRPAYDKDGKTFASIRKREDERYYFHGCHELPKDAEPSPAITVPTSLPAGTERSKDVKIIEEPTAKIVESTASTQISGTLSERLAPSSEPLPVTPVVEYGASAADTRVSEYADNSVINTESFATSPSPPPSGQITPILTSSPSPERGKSLSKLPQVPQTTQSSDSHPNSASEQQKHPTDVVFPGSRTSVTPALHARAPLLSPQPTDSISPHLRPTNTTCPSSSTSSHPIKRSASPDGLAHAPPKRHRQRRSLSHVEIPLALAAQDEQILRLRKALEAAVNRDTQGANKIARLEESVATQQKTIHESSGRLEASEKKSRAFREMAKRFYADAVDQQNVFVDRHTAMSKILLDANNLKASVERLLADTRREMGLTEAVHQQIDSVLNAAQAELGALGLSEEYDAFVSEAMELDG